MHRFFPIHRPQPDARRIDWRTCAIEMGERDGAVEAVEGFKGGCDAVQEGGHGDSRGYHRPPKRDGEDLRNRIRSRRESQEGGRTVSTTWYGSYASDRLASVARWCCILEGALVNEGDGGGEVLQETL